MTIGPMGERRDLPPLSCSTLAYAGSSLETAFAGLAQAGFDYVEIAAIPGYCDHLVEPGDEKAANASRAADLARRFGLHVVSVSAHIDLVAAPPGHLPGFGREEAAEMLLRRIRLAAELGAFVVNTQGANPASMADERLFLVGIEEVAREAERCGVVLALEVADGLTASARSIRGLMARLAGSPVRINYDTGNLPFYSGLDPVAEYPAVHEYVSHVHLKDHVGGPGDYDFPAIGEGSLDLAAFVAQAMDLGYTGPISAEIEFRHPTARPPVEDLTRAARVSLEAMRRYVAAATPR